ncbi:LysM peptidoglycan-binding domain-containing protein [Janibacter anophelis]|uniref:LysM peptidoglycan-binding domain-containing protein n=1 Tax=Janibacter anophelis TaxID=319054 RepID=UPI0008311E16|nr:hypothetical protein [Janibacter anophelis]
MGAAIARTLATGVTLAALPGGVALTTARVAGGRRALGQGLATGGDPSAAVLGLVSLLAALVVCWLTCGLALAVMAEAPGRVGAVAARLRDRVTPAVVRRWAAITLGASVTASVLPGTAVAAVQATPRTGTPDPGWLPSPTTAPATSVATSSPTGLPDPGWTGRPATTPTTRTESTGTSPTSTPAVRPSTSAPIPGWTPRRPSARHRTDSRLLTGRHRVDPVDEVVVRRGDSLWTIAAARLGPDATASEVARAWPRWHAANAERIGPDPHLLLPGTRLSPPTHDHDHDQHSPGATPMTKGTR